MNTTLPRLSFASRVAALAAAVLVTIGTLATIDRLAGADGAAPLMARVPTSATA